MLQHVNNDGYRFFSAFYFNVILTERIHHNTNMIPNYSINAKLGLDPAVHLLRA